MILKESNGATLRVLCVICSILVLTHFSPINPIPFFIIHIIFQIVLTTLSVDVIAGDKRGTFGAGGNVGRLISILGINDGNSGNLGGAGSCGIVGIFGVQFKFHADTVKSTLTVGGDGSSGNAGSVTVFGTKCMFGKTTSNQRRI